MVYVLLANGFEETEALTPANLLMRAGFKVLLVSVNGDEYVKGTHGFVVKTDISIDALSLDDTELLLLPGGMPGAENIYNSEKAREIISGARASAEFVFDKLDKLQKEKDSKDFSSKYSSSKKDLRNMLLEADRVYNPIDEIDDNYALPRELIKGDRVILKNLGSEAVLLENPDKTGNVLVQSGIAKTKTNIKNLMLVTDEIAIKLDASRFVQQATPKKKAVIKKSFSPSFDVRGRNIEDAWMEIDKYIDEALVCGVKSVTIVHGKGTGALRKGLWEFFRTDSRVKKHRNGEYGEGDFGVTVLELK